MAKFIKTFEDRTVTSTLVFRGIKFNLTMGEWEEGKRESKETCFSDQLSKAFPNDTEVEDFLNEWDIDMLDCGDEDDIEELLEELNHKE